MPAAARKAAISFGMVHIPVSLYTAVQEKGVGFNQLTRDGVRVRQKKVREDTGAEVQADQIVKGYEYAKGQYVILTDDELERIKTERDRTIRILHFAPPEPFHPSTSTSPISARRMAATRLTNCCAGRCWMRA